MVLLYCSFFSVQSTATAARFEHSTMNRDFEIIEKFTRVHIIYTTSAIPACQKFGLISKLKILLWISSRKVPNFWLSWRKKMTFFLFLVCTCCLDQYAFRIKCGSWICGWKHAQLSKNDIIYRVRKSTKKWPWVMDVTWRL